MKRCPLPAILLVTAAFVRAQDASGYKVGDADRYAVRLEVATSLGDVVQKSGMTKTVVRVYDDGSADVQTTFSGATMGLTGDETPMPSGATTPTVERLDALGRAIDRAKKGGFSLDPSDFALMGLPDMKDAAVGQVFPLDDGATQGKATILGLDAHTIKVGTDFTIREETGTEAMHVKVVTTFDLATNRLVQSEGTLEGGLPDEDDIKVERVKFTLTHLP